FIFFFLAEDGIRDFHVTGVQTCALPISSPSWRLNAILPFPMCPLSRKPGFLTWKLADGTACMLPRVYQRKSKSVLTKPFVPFLRSEERRVGNECTTSINRLDL